MYTYDFSDPDSGVRDNELCLGRTTRDCRILDWYSYPYSPTLTHVYRIPDGVPAWLRLRATNNGTHTHYFSWSLFTKYLYINNYHG